MSKKSKNKHETRREFLKKSAGSIGLAAIASPAAVLLNSCEYHWDNNNPLAGVSIDIDVTAHEKLMQEGSGIVESFGGSVNHGIPVVIVNIKDNKFACYSSLCTHMMCLGKDVWVQSRRGKIICDCHGSKFDAFDNAKPVKGPAERPLKQFPTSFDPETNILTLYF